jgi:hypothetical protein
MSEITVCRYCKQRISEDADDYVIISKTAEPREIAHVACEQTSPKKPISRIETQTMQQSCRGRARRSIHRSSQTTPLRTKP